MANWSSIQWDNNDLIVADTPTENGLNPMTQNAVYLNESHYRNPIVCQDGGVFQFQYNSDYQITGVQVRLSFYIGGSLVYQQPSWTPTVQGTTYYLDMENVNVQSQSEQILLNGRFVLQTLLNVNGGTVPAFDTASILFPFVLGKEQRYFSGTIYFSFLVIANYFYRPAPASFTGCLHKELI